MDDIQPTSQYLSPQSDPDLLFRVIAAERRRQIVRDNQDRDNRDLRIATVKLINEMEKIVEYAAEGLAKKKGKSDPVDIDECSDLLIWQFAEFFHRSIIARDSMFFQKLRRAHQFSEKYTSAWFELERVWNPKMRAHDWDIPAMGENQL